MEDIFYCGDGDFSEAEEKHIKVKEVRMLFQDYAPIPAQKALLARWSGDGRWNNLRPPLLAMASDKLDALETALVNDYGFNA